MLKVFSLKNLSNVSRHLLAQICPFVVHRQEHTLDVESRVQHGANAAKGGDEFGKAFEGEVLAV